jgi:modulator of FtsH protease HflK
MPWTNQGGGGGGGPWGSGGSRGPGGQGPWNRGGPQTPDLEELLRRSQDRFRRMFPGGTNGSRGVVLIVVAAILIWLASGLYRVQPDEQGVVLRFGQWVRTTATGSGLNYHLPFPIETVLKPKVTTVNRVDVGFRTTSAGGSLRGVPEEALMLTGDENIVDVNFTVFWVIKDAGKYLFNIRDPEDTVKALSESAMREVIGQTKIQAALAEARRDVETNARKLLQQVLDQYGSGIDVTQLQLQKVDPPAPVVESFRDVQRARADAERARNEAEAYANDILPRARGDAERIIQEGEAYKQEVVARAQGDAQRFLSIYEQYKQAKDVTTKRIYLETMEEILRKAQKIIIDQKNGVVPYLPLPGLTPKPPAPPAAPAAPAADSSRPTAGR